MRHTANILVALIITCLSVFALYCYFWVGVDDDLITLWAGESLGSDWWFINYNGERSEMSSSILGALVAKLASLITSDAAYALNKLFLFLCFPGALWLLWHHRDIYIQAAENRYYAIAVIICVGLNHTIMSASLTGLETPLQIWLMLWCGLMLGGYLKQSGEAYGYRLLIAQLLLVLVRPEGFWIIGVVLAVLPIRFGRAAISKKHRYIWLWPLIFFVVLICVRTVATGVPFPNAYYAKVILTTNSIRHGFRTLYHFYTMTHTRLILMIATWLAAAYLLWRWYGKKLSGHDFVLLALLTVAVGQLAFYALTHGGMTLWYNRFIAPAVFIQNLILIQLCALSCYALSRKFVLCVAVLCTFCIISQAYGISRTVHLRPIQPLISKVWYSVNTHSLKKINNKILRWNRSHRRDGNALRQCIRHRIGPVIDQKGVLRVLTYQAGFFPYFVKKHHPDAEIQFFDLKSLIQPDAGLLMKKNFKRGLKRTQFSKFMVGRRKINIKLQKFKPNMIYGLVLTKNDKRRLSRMGWKSLCSNDNAQVWIKQKK